MEGKIASSLNSNVQKLSHYKKERNLEKNKIRTETEKKI